jgi:spore germination cell wall hydrolase CwlJ-like protein
MPRAFCWLALSLCAVFVATVSRGPAVAGPAEYGSLECMALNVYWEARSESRSDQRAVAHVTLNRMRSSEFPDTVCDVVHQGGEDELYGCQFHWWCDGKVDEPQNPIAWQMAIEVARRVLAGNDPDSTDGALFFHNDDVSPEWASARVRTVQIGTHIFYR